MEPRGGSADNLWRKGADMRVKHRRHLWGEARRRLAALTQTQTLLFTSGNIIHSEISKVFRLLLFLNNFFKLVIQNFGARPVAPHSGFDRCFFLCASLRGTLTSFDFCSLLEQNCIYISFIFFFFSGSFIFNIWGKSSRAGCFLVLNPVLVVLTYLWRCWLRTTVGVRCMTAMNVCSCWSRTEDLATTEPSRPCRSTTSRTPRVTALSGFVL